MSTHLEDDFEGASSPRVNKNGVPVFVTWGDRESGRTLPAFLKDVSLGGAVIDSPAGIPTGTLVSIRLMKDIGSGPVRAKVLKLYERRRVVASPWWKKRACLIRVAFVDGGSYEFLKTVLDGLFRVNEPSGMRLDGGREYRETA